MNGKTFSIDVLIHQLKHCCSPYLLFNLTLYGTFASVIADIAVHEHISFVFLLQCTIAVVNIGHILLVDVETAHGHGLLGDEYVLHGGKLDVLPIHHEVHQVSLRVGEPAWHFNLFGYNILFVYVHAVLYVIRQLLVGVPGSEYVP